MYQSLHQLSTIGQSLGKTKVKRETRDRAPIGLSVNLSLALQKCLYPGLYKYAERTQRDFVCHVSDLSNVVSSPETAFSQSFLSSVAVRNLIMLPGEFISHILSPESGLISEPVSQGRMLVLTNRRVITFGRKKGIRETVMVPLEEVKAVTVRAGQRTKGTLFQGAMMIIAAAICYVLLAYWLTGQIEGPRVPVIRMDLVSFVVLLVVSAGVAMLAQLYFLKPDGEVTFQGDSVTLTFPFRRGTSEDETYILVNAAFVARQKLMS